MIDITSQPKRIKDSFLWADYMELVCLASDDKCVTPTDIVDKILETRDLEEDIETAFGKVCDGEIVGVRIARNSVNRQSKGFCYLEFNTPQDAQSVVKASAKKRIIVGGRPVRIDYDTGRMKGSFRSESGRLWTKEAKEQQQQQRGGQLPSDL